MSFCDYICEKCYLAVKPIINCVVLYFMLNSDLESHFSVCFVQQKID